jgi:HD-like signal output (HDOD) protein/DNA-binding NarL/FixJ family response regulator
LVVDDEPAVRMITMRELSRIGFSCDAARDGMHAKELLADARYDVVVTDLRMPEMNGHALAVDLLAIPNPPVVVILTGVTEPRLAKDLLARGVDDILFKPIDQSILASKVKALVDRRAAHAAPAAPASVALETPRAGGTASPAADARLWPTIPAAELDARLGDLGIIMPISRGTMDVAKMTSDDAVGIRELAAAIELDASLTAAILRMANSVHYNLMGRAASGVDEAVVRIGQKRTGEVALAMSVVGALNAQSAPWIDVSLAWRRSLAAGLAIDVLTVKGGHSQIGSGLFLSAIMHPLGRIVLSGLYPARYQEMVQRAQQTGEALDACEERMFQRTHAHAMAQVLESWQLSDDIIEPLRYSLHDSSEIGQLPEPLRSRVELVQTAVTVARFAVGQWEPWDVPCLPAACTLEKLRVESLSDLIQQTRVDLGAIGELMDFAATSPSLATAEKDPPYPCVPYCNLSEEPFDVLAEILPAIGISPHRCMLDDVPPDVPAIVNCLGVPFEQVHSLFTPRACHMLITNTHELHDAPSTATVLALPASVGTIRSTLLKIVGAIT